MGALEDKEEAEAPDVTEKDRRGECIGWWWWSWLSSAIMPSPCPGATPRTRSASAFRRVYSALSREVKDQVLRGCVNREYRESVCSWGLNRVC